MKIKDGYNSAQMEIIISKSGNRTAELWIKFGTEIVKKETLSYITLDELLNLKKEIDTAINNIVHEVEE